MGAFEFQALDAGGRSQRGVLQGDTARAVRQVLRERGLTPVEVVELKQEQRGGSVAGRKLFERGLDGAQLAVLTRQLATLIKAGLPLDEAFAALAEQADSNHQRKLLVAVRARMLEGAPLAQALGEHPRAFDALYCAAVSSGEQSGQIGVVLTRLADHLENRAVAGSKLGQALIYPTLLFVVAVGVAVGLLTYVVPQVVQVFAQLKAELPPLTRFMLGVSAVLRDWGVLLLIGLLGAGFGLLVLLRQSGFRLAFDGLLLRLPLIGRFIKLADTGRFARTMGLATAASVPVLDALKVATSVVNNRVLHAALERVRVRVREGAPLALALRESNRFPALLTRMVMSGEKSGELTEMLERSADLHEQQLSSQLGTLTALVEPLLILLMGGVVLTIVLAVLLPIFDLNQIMGR
jgi:general secretion pathway protein F